MSSKLLLLKKFQKCNFCQCTLVANVFCQLGPWFGCRFGRVLVGSGVLLLLKSLFLVFCLRLLLDDVPLRYWSGFAGGDGVKRRLSTSKAEVEWTNSPFCVSQRIASKSGLTGIHSGGGAICLPVTVRSRSSTFFKNPLMESKSESFPASGKRRSQSSKRGRSSVAGRFLSSWFLLFFLLISGTEFVWVCSGVGADDVWFSSLDEDSGKSGKESMSRESKVPEVKSSVDWPVVPLLSLVEGRDAIEVGVTLMAASVVPKNSSNMVFQLNSPFKDPNSGASSWRTFLFPADFVFRRFFALPLRLRTVFWGVVCFLFLFVNTGGSSLSNFGRMETEGSDKLLAGDICTGPNRGSFLRKLPVKQNSFLNIFVTRCWSKHLRNCASEVTIHKCWKKISHIYVSAKRNGQHMLRSKREWKKVKILKRYILNKKSQPNTSNSMFRILLYLVRQPKKCNFDRPIITEITYLT